MDISIKKIRHHFGNLSNYHEAIEDAYGPCPIVEDEDDNALFPNVVDEPYSPHMPVVDVPDIEIISETIAYVQGNHKFPSFNDYRDYRKARNLIKRNYGSLAKFQNHVAENYSDDIDDYLIGEDTIFSERNNDNLHDAIRRRDGPKTYVITTAINERPLASTHFLKSIRNYCAIKDGTFLVFPASESLAVKRWSFCPELKNDIFITSRMNLNENIILNPILNSSKIVNPTMGISRAAQDQGSLITGSPKQNLEFIAASNAAGSLPRAIMTTGAITVGNYQQKLGLYTKSSYIAEIDHVIGALIVEIVNDKEFHFRQIQCDENGGFTDLGEYYGPDNLHEDYVEEHELHAVLGDWHEGQVDTDVEDVLEEMFTDLPITDVYLHDFFDGRSITHHDLGHPVKTAQKAQQGLHILERELISGATRINWFLDRIPGRLIMICGNHDEFLARYLESGRYVNDPVNHRLALELAIAYFDGENPLRKGYERTGLIKDPKRVVWLERDQSYKIAGIQMGDHGDRGFNGSKGSLLAAERAHQNAIIGHSHSGAIMRGIYRVGTSTILRMDYNKGASNWTQSHCLVDAETGARQMINVINKKYRG